MRRMGGALVAATLVLAAWVGAGPPAGAGGGAGPSTIGGTFLEALVAEAWATDPALVALRARDKGYGAEQILDALGDGEVSDDGTVTDGGRPETPEGPPTNVLAQQEEAEVLAAIERNQRGLTKPKAVKPPPDVLEDHVFVLVVLLGLMAEGYTMEQIVVDGILADGVRTSGPYAPMRIVDEDGEEIAPDDAPADDPIVESVIREMAAIVQGADVLDPDFTPRYDASFTARLTVSGATVTVTAKGRLGVEGEEGGDVYLGRLTGRLDVPAGDRCPAERVPIAIGLTGLEPESGRIVELDHTWAYAGPPSTGGGTTSSGGGFCITAAEAPELVGALGGLLGSLRGPVRDGATLETNAGIGTARLRLDAR